VKIRTIVSTVTAVLIGACSCAGTLQIPPPFPDSDAGPTVNALCASACGVLDQADCGVPNCTAVCIADQNQGVASQLSPQCVVDAGVNPAALTSCGACQ
jgi:hypothetical protein